MGWATAIYFRVERRGPPLPDGPVVVVANHPNALLDPLVLFRTAGRATRPLAKAPLFEQAFVGTFLKGLGGLPVYRHRDFPGETHRNEATFDAAVDALRRGEAIQIYPEGQSHSGPSLTPLKTGAARIAFLAEERADWRLGLRIVPVGLTYERKHLFRGRAVATVGEPVTLASYRSLHDDDPQEAVRALTAELTDRLTAVTLNTETPADRELIEAAEALYAVEKGIVGSRERSSLGDRLPRLQAFARELAVLRAEDPEEVERLARAVGRYRRIRLLLGSVEGEVPRRFRPLAVVVHLVGVGLPLLLLLPAAVVATVAWAVPYHVPRIVVRAVRPNLDAISTYKLASAVLAFPITLVLWVALAWWWGGARWALGAALGLPVAGLAWVVWKDRLDELSADVRVFLRAAPRRRLRERLTALRSELVDEFDRVVERHAGGREG